MKPFFSGEGINTGQITLIGKVEILSYDLQVAET